MALVSLSLLWVGRFLDIWGAGHALALSGRPVDLIWELLPARSFLFAGLSGYFRGGRQESGEERRGRLVGGEEICHPHAALPACVLQC